MGLREREVMFVIADTTQPSEGMQSRSYLTPHERGGSSCASIDEVNWLDRIFNFFSYMARGSGRSGEERGVNLPM